MKTSVSICVHLWLLISASADPIDFHPSALKTPVLASNPHPFRKVGDRHWDLRPFTNAPRSSLPSELRAWTIHSTRVLQVFPTGLLLYAGENPIVLINHPSQDTLTDGAQIGPLIALEAGTFQYRDVRGGLRTVKKYDYGTPYNPFAAAAR